MMYITFLIFFFFYTLNSLVPFVLHTKFSTITANEASHTTSLTDAGYTHFEKSFKLDTLTISRLCPHLYTQFHTYIFIYLNKCRQMLQLPDQMHRTDLVMVRRGFLRLGRSNFAASQQTVASAWNERFHFRMLDWICMLEGNYTPTSRGNFASFIKSPLCDEISCRLWWCVCCCTFCGWSKPA